MNKIRINSKVKQHPKTTRNREDDVIELIQRIVDLKVASQRGYCCKTGTFWKEFTSFMHNNGIERLCEISCSECRVKYYNFVQELVAKKLSEEYQVDFEKVIDGIEEY